jgi:hypothetical protein
VETRADNLGGDEDGEGGGYVPATYSRPQQLHLNQSTTNEGDLLARADPTSDYQQDVSKMQGEPYNVDNRDGVMHGRSKIHATLEDHGNIFC